MRQPWLRLEQAAAEWLAQRDAHRPKHSLHDKEQVLTPSLAIRDCVESAHVGGDHDSVRAFVNLDAVPPLPHPVLDDGHDRSTVRVEEQSVAGRGMCGSNLVISLNDHSPTSEPRRRDVPT